MVKLNNAFANIKIYCFGNEVRFPETKIRVSGNTLRSIPETNIQLAMVLIKNDELIINNECNLTLSK